MARFLCALGCNGLPLSIFSIIAISTNHGWAGYNWAADNVDKLPLYWLLWWLYHNGLYAVQIFWMISGFIFFWKYSHPDQSADGLGLSVFCPTIFSTLPPAFCDADCSRTAAAGSISIHMGYRLFIMITISLISYFIWLLRQIGQVHCKHSMDQFGAYLLKSWSMGFSWPSYRVSGQAFAYV